MAGRRSLDGQAASARTHTSRAHQAPPPPATPRDPLRRTASWAGLPSPRSATGAAASRRPLHGRRVGRSREQPTLPLGTLVTFEEQGISGPLFGSIVAVAADGTCTVELLDGSHRCGIRNAKRLAQDIWETASPDVQDVGSIGVEVTPASFDSQPHRQPRSDWTRRCPVSFFLEGSPKQMFGHIRGVNSNGSFNVDLVGGGRLAGLEVVTPCKEEDVSKAAKSKQRMETSRPAYAEYATRNSSLAPSLSTSQLDTSAISTGTLSGITSSTSAPLASGQPVSFYLDGILEQYFGRIRGICPDGSYTVDLVGGGRKVGVEAAAKCTEEDLARESRAKAGMITRGNAWSEYVTANSQLSHGRPLSSGPHCGCPVSLPSSSGGQACGRICGRVRSLAADGTYTVDLANGARRAGVRQLFPCTEEGLAREARSMLGGMKRDQGNVSMLSLLSTASTADVTSEVGSPVSLRQEGILAPFYGRVRSVSADGRYTVDLVGGGRKVGVEVVTPRTEEDLAREARGKAAWVTRPEPYAEYRTPNTPYSPAPGSPTSPRLRGVAIARVLPSRECSLTRRSRVGLEADEP